MAYEMVMPYHLHMPSYFLETFTEYPYIEKMLFTIENCLSLCQKKQTIKLFIDSAAMRTHSFILYLRPTISTTEFIPGSMLYTIK